MRKVIKRFPHFFLSISAALFFGFFLGRVHLFDWDEVNFATVAKEMLLSHNWMRTSVDYLPFSDKPPLFFWMQSISMKIFGINEWAARLPNALAGIATINFVFFLGKKHHNSKMAWQWVLVYLGSFTSQLYFRSGIIDPWFNLFIFFALYFLSQAISSSKKHVYFFLMGISLALAFLTKGPVAILVIGLVGLYILIQNNFRRYFALSHLVLLALPILSVIFWWYLLGNDGSPSKVLGNFISIQKDLFSKNVANHAQPFFYHPLVLLVGMFPASILAFRGLTKKVGDKRNKAYLLENLLRIFFWVVLILFSLVKTKIVHYSSMTYLPITYFAAIRLKNIKLNKLEISLLWVISLIIVAALSLLSLVGNNPTFKNTIANFINNPITTEALQLEGPWTGMEFGIVGIFFIGVLFVLYAHKFQYLFFWVAIFCPMLLVSFAPKIEAHSQKELVAFHKARQNEDAYFISHSFATYIPNFYARNKSYREDDEIWQIRKDVLQKYNCNSYSNLPLEKRGAFSSEIWQRLLTGKIDKPVYISILKKDQHKMSQYPKLEFLYERGPYAFYKRTLLQ